MVLGVTGAILLALNNSLSGYGFVAFLFSNMLWIAFGACRKAYGLIVMQMVFTVTSLIGIFRWLVVS